MQPLRSVGRLLDWFEGRLELPALDFVLNGDALDKLVVYHAFAGLYPDQPFLRMVMLDSGLTLDEIRTAVLSCRLPGETTAIYRGHMQRFYPDFGLHQVWHMASRMCHNYGLPVGVIAFGLTARGDSRMVFRVHDMANPNKVLELLQRTAQPG